MTLETSILAISAPLAAIDLSDIAEAAAARATLQQQINDAIAVTKARLAELPALTEAARKKGRDVDAAARRAMGENVPSEPTVGDLEAERQELADRLAGLNKMLADSEAAKRGERDAPAERMAAVVDPLVDELALDVELKANGLLLLFARLIALGAATGSARAYRLGKSLEDALLALGAAQIVERGDIAVDSQLVDALATGEAAMSLANRKVISVVPFPRPSADGAAFVIRV